MISIKTSGSFKTEKFLDAIGRGALFATLDHYGAVGVSALASATPIDSSRTRNSWSYEIVKKRGRYSIIWHNTNLQSGIPIAIILQYGHGTGTGGWVEGRDYINPAIRPVFDQMVNEVWEQVKRG